MQTHHWLLVVSFLSSMLGAAACLSPVARPDAGVSAAETTDDEVETGEAADEVDFSASNFNFSTMVQDDGRGKAGGWQRASAVLKFADWRGFGPNFWQCNLTVGMPIPIGGRGAHLSGASRADHRRCRHGSFVRGDAQSVRLGRCSLLHRISRQNARDVLQSIQNRCYGSALMKQTTTELIGLVHRFYPRGVRVDEPGYGDTEEHRRMVEAVLCAERDYERWKSMLARLEVRSPGCVRDLSLHILGGAFESAYCGKLCLPRLDPDDEEEHELGFRVSFMAPWYVIYSSRWRHLQGDPSGDVASRPRIRLDVSSDAQPYARGLAQEIEATYGYDAMPPEIGEVVVPDVATGVRDFGTATIYDCLLSDDWKR